MTFVDSLGPRFVTLLASSDGWCRWVATIANDDTEAKPIQVLITIDSEGGLTLATKPMIALHSTWSPPIYPERR